MFSFHFWFQWLEQNLWQLWFMKSKGHNGDEESNDDDEEDEHNVWLWLIVCGLLPGWLPLLRLHPSGDDDCDIMLCMIHVPNLTTAKWK